MGARAVDRPCTRGCSGSDPPGCVWRLHSAPAAPSCSRAISPSRGHPCGSGTPASPLSLVMGACRPRHSGVAGYASGWRRTVLEERPPPLTSAFSASDPTATPSAIAEPPLSAAPNLRRASASQQPLVLIRLVQPCSSPPPSEPACCAPRPADAARGAESARSRQAARRPRRRQSSSSRLARKAARPAVGRA